MQKLVLYSTTTISLALLLFVACSKDKFETKPSIEIKSINPTQVSAFSGSYSEITLQFTDKQGDLDSVFLYKVWLNSRGRSPQFPILPFPLPPFPEKNKGEIKLTLDAALTLVAAPNPSPQPDAPNGKQPDTIIFKIIVKDRGGNVSDTATTEPLVIERT
jgi:hypothetical protein